ncbi:helix-turn-helix transcriptional regulator [Paenibacillus graminis]|uniref:helix-turn-helix domain-containing protein n=1 Tax=Paenibacillus graminis TaxID=189425 RepID=UPI002DB9903F|nr:helix-turn-helix transcriptional regulator [Paenibacillus graminis]MEC0168138.1 helix-turn-helix transcriptional regulator [Paenibacillus graminis]
MNEFNILGLKDSRLKVALSVEKTSELSGISPDQLREYEKNPSIVPASDALILAKLYNTSVDFISFK